MESDACDLSELCYAGTEFCQVGKQTCCVPLELYDLPDLHEILSLNSWNKLLSEEERLQLSDYLPDMDHETFLRTITELLSGANFHLGSPVDNLFTRLTGGLCEPRVVLGPREASLFQKRRHYHYLRGYQNKMVGKLIRVRNTWKNCKCYSIKEKRQALKLMKDRKKFSDVNNGYSASETDFESEDSVEQKCKKKIENWTVFATFKSFHPKGYVEGCSTQRSFTKEYDLGFSRYQVDYEVDENNGYEQGYKISSRSSLLKPGKKQEFLKMNDKEKGRYSGLPHCISKRKSSDQGVTVASYAPPSKNLMYPEHEWPLNRANEQLSYCQTSKFDDRNIRAKNLKAEGEFKAGKTKTGSDLVVKSHNLSSDPYYRADCRGKTSGSRIKSNLGLNGGKSMEYFRNDMFDQNEEADSDIMRWKCD